MSTEKKDEKVYRVAGVHVELANLKDVKTLDELKKKEIFSHLDESSQEKANAEVFAALKVAESPKAVAPAPVAQTAPAAVAKV